MERRLFLMKTAVAVFMPYLCTVVSSSAVNVKVGKPTFIVAFLNRQDSSGFFLQDV